MNIICKGNAILFGHSFNILWLMTSGPDAYLDEEFELCLIGMWKEEDQYWSKTNYHQRARYSQAHANFLANFCRRQ